MLPGIKVIPERQETKSNKDDVLKDDSLAEPGTPTSATAKPLAFQEGKEEANQPLKQQQEEQINPSDLSFTTYDAFFLNLEDGVLPFSFQGYNILQESITSKLIEAPLAFIALFQLLVLQLISNG